MFKVRDDIKAIYKSQEDIPLIIAPTENGWLAPHDNRKLKPGPATIIVTAKNAEPIEEDITILKQRNEDGKIIEIVKPNVRFSKYRKKPREDGKKGEGERRKDCKN
jgi:hypothetical protein